jgi:hypothetical protein
MLRLELTFPGLTLSFYPAHDPAPSGAGLAFAWLVSVSPINELASVSLVASMGAGESGSVSVNLDNTGNQAGDLLGLPLRVPAQVFDGDALLFSGIVARVQSGIEFSLDLEA